MVATGYVWHERYAWHDTGTHAGFLPPGGMVQPLRHVESAESKARLASLVEVSGLAGQLARLAVEPVDERDLARVHTEEHIERVRAGSAALRGGDAGDLITPFGSGGYDVVRLTAGGTVAAVDAVLRGTVGNAYALVRPPGHHATPERGMGFCVFNNIGVAVARAREEHDLGRVAIVDWDVHHGNGTQAVFYDDPSTLTISLHQDRLFPQDSGFLHERGVGAGEGTNLNVPLPPGCGDGAYAAALERVVLPAIEAFRPELVVVACGFDAGAWDPMGRQMVSTSGFVTLTRGVMEAAASLCQGRLVLSHEGGYNPATVPFHGLAVIETLAGVSTGVVDPHDRVVTAMAGHELAPHQASAIDEAAALVDGIPA
jgi:acetoin utilization deacetylase AcuC-like enzyme